MKKYLAFVILVLNFSNCKSQQLKTRNVVTIDIENFWNAYDKITSTQDSILQYKYLDSLYFQKGTAGLKAIRAVRNYTAQDYIHAINNNPQFWASIRKNTLKANKLGSGLETGIQKLQALYPGLKPARIYFTIGALRTNGTTLDSLVLIGSELAMTDKNTISSEFPAAERSFRQTFFNSNPIDGLVLLNVHEFVHTQQHPMVHNLLSEVIYEGIAEFVSVTALGVPSNAPAIEFGMKNNDEVRDQFEHEMFYTVNRDHWLWSNARNKFGVRDLGYYIGYRMSEIYYEKSTDKKDAIKKLIQLDYTNETEIEKFVDETHFFSAPLEQLYQSFEKKRPTVINILPFGNNSENVSPKTKQITFEFSEPLNGHNTGLDYGPLGAGYFPKISFTNRIWANDNKTWTINVDLEPNKQYQFLMDNNFRNQEGIPLKPLLIEFKTAE